MRHAHAPISEDNDAPHWLVYLAFGLIFALFMWVFVPWQVVIIVYAVCCAIMFPMMAIATRSK